MTDAKGIGKLDRSLVHGVAWTAVGRGVTQLFTWLATFALARLLTPEDFGVVAMASIFTGAVTLISDMGLGSAVVTFQDLSDEELAQMHGTSLMLGLLGFVATLAAAIPMGRIFNSPELPAVTAVMGLSFLVSGARPVVLGLLQREFQFKYIAGVETAQVLAVASLQFALAFAGWRYWSMIWAEIAGITLSTLLLLRKRTPAMAFPRWKTLRRVTRFTGDILVTRLCWYGYINSDFMIVGKLRGQHDLGVYKMAWNFASAPVHKISELVNRVTPSIFSAVKNDPPALRRYVLSISEVLGFVVFPMTVGMAIVARDFVTVFLGNQWLDAIAPLRLLSVYMSIRAVTTAANQILTYTGDTRFGMWNAVYSAVLLPTAFLIGSRWGLVGVASAWIFAHPISLIPAYTRVFHRIQLSFGRYVATLWPAASSSGLMVLGYFGLLAVLPANIDPKIRLGAAVATGGIVYCGWVFLWYRTRIRSILTVIRSSSGKGPAV